MSTNRRILPRLMTLIICSLLVNTGCFDVFGISDMVTNSKPESSDEGSAFAKHISVLHVPAQLQVDKTVQLTAIVNDSNDKQIMDAKPVWDSSAQQILAINNDGMATARRPGKVTVTAAFGRLTNTFTIQVIDDIPNAILVDNKEIITDELDYFTINASVVNRFDEKLDIPIEWTADNTRILRFRKDGSIFARTPGITQIHATAGELKETIKLRINAVGPEEYKLKAARVVPSTKEDLTQEAIEAGEQIRQEVTEKAAAAQAEQKP